MFRHHQRRLVLSIVACCVLLTSGAAAKSTAVKVDRVVIVKSTHTLMLMSHGQVLKTYKVSLGRGGNEAKQQQGDRETPEGEYVIDSKNPHSRFHQALHISYPNARDRERARKQGVSPGGDVEIHGIEERWAWLGSLHRAVDWTAGCIAVTNPEIEVIYKLVPVGTPVEIRADEKPIESTDSVNLKDGSLRVSIPLVQRARTESLPFALCCPLQRSFRSGRSWGGGTLFLVGGCEVGERVFPLAPDLARDPPPSPDTSIQIA